MNEKTRKPNLILILLDGARWDRMGISDEIQKLKKEGTTLSNISSAIPYTFGAMNVLFTGLYGKENGVDAYYKMFKLKDSVTFLPEILQKYGYFTSCKLISDKVISKRGFNIHEQYDEYKEDPIIEHPNFLEKIYKNSQNKPFFTFLQFSKIHTSTVTEVLKKYEWDDEEFYKNKENNLKVYDQSFLEAGKYAAKIYQKINELDIQNETILIFFTDHGTGIGERFGERNYGVFLYEETIRTNYIFIGKDIQKNKESDNLLGTINFLSTILELASIKEKIQTPGRSFMQILKQKSEISISDEFTFSETGGLQGPFPSPLKPNVFCIKSKKYKLIYFQATDQWHLFDLEKDPSEKENLHGKRSKVEEKMKTELIKWIER